MPIVPFNPNNMTDKTRSDLETKIKLVIETIRPYLVADGGDIEFVAIKDDMSVEVFLSGACNACSMSSQTLSAVESAIKNTIPEVNRLIAIDYTF